MNTKKKVLFDSPARVAVAAGTGKILAFGQSALELAQLGAPDINIVSLFRDGIPVDTDLCREYLLWMKDSIAQSRLERVLPYPVIPVVPVGFAAPYSMLFEATLRSAHFFPKNSQEAVLGDVWMELGDKTNEEQVLLIRMGATQTQIALISQSLIVAHHTLHIGGDDLDRDFVRFLRRAHSMSVPINSIVSIKESYTKASVSRAPFSAVIRGKHTKRNDAASLTIGEEDVVPLYTHFFETLSVFIYEAMVTKLHFTQTQTQKIPILLSGGLSMFSLAREAVEAVIGSQVRVVSRPTVASVLGIVTKVTT